ncbi:unnamed protein product [Paramecium primaurelia]|uniref:Zinc finger PHD-type domain-containing protein n=1 Tax=Paramecium primaurelia TaxID=5886 RepID=A0A8S1JWH6_PARPR|nr:unnamed protein product [Paramecium primaurelia]
MSFIDEAMEVEQNDGKVQEVHQQNRFLHSKRMIIVDEKCQAIVPDKPEKTFEKFIQHRQSLIFQSEKIEKLQNIDDYLLFAQSLILSQLDEQTIEDPKKKSKGFSGDGLILSGLSITQEQVNERALMFLKQMDYNIIKAKFYLLFPSLLVYNQYKHRHSLQFTNEYMNEKIEQYISKLNEDKMMQQNKWKQDLMDMINSKQKVHLTQLQTLLEQGQQLKYEVPESIKQIHSTSIQIQKQINKLLKEKQTLEKLSQSLEKLEEQIPIITPEIQQLREQVQKSETFYQKLLKLPIPIDDNNNFDEIFENLISNSQSQKIQLKILINYNIEYKQLPIEIKAFEQLHKRLYEYVLDLVEKISKFTKIQQTKTRLGQYISNQGEKTEKITLSQAGIFNQQIIKLIVTCDDFDYFNELYQQALELNEKVKQQIDDPEMQQKLLGEVLDCPFYLDVQERLQNMIDYTQILDSIKLKMSERQHQIANQQIQMLLGKGIINDELKYLQNQTLKVLEWNQLADEIISYHQNISLIDIYDENFELKQYPSTLFYPTSDIIKQLDPEKVKEIEQILERIQIWKEQLISLMDCKQVQTTRKNNQNKTFYKLWELFKEGLRYKQEITLMTKVKDIIISILDWHAQVYMIKQILRLSDDQSQQIDGIDTICRIYIQRNGTSHTSDQIEKLQKFQSPFISGSKDLQIIQTLIQHTEKWETDAKQAIQTQNQEQIKYLLDESLKLPIDEQLFKELQNLYASNQKVNWILSTIATSDPLFDQILQTLKNDESIKQMKEEMLAIYADNPQNKKKKEGIKLSKLAQNFFLNFQNTINSYLVQLTQLDDNKLKKLQPIRIQRLKEYQKDVYNDDINKQIEDWIQQYQQWQMQITNLNEQQQQKKKKKRIDSESQPETFSLTGELLYNFKVPQLLCLVLQGIEKNYISQELISSIEKLVIINKQAQIALSVQSVKEITYFSEVFMPQFYVMGKKFRVINNWMQMATEMINDIPRLKNIIMIQKLRPFLEYLDQLQPQEFMISKSVQQQQPSIKQKQQQQQQSQIITTQSNIKKKTQKYINKLKNQSQDESQPTYDQESQSLKHSKRVKQVSKLMRDDNIAFYDSNIPLAKAFRSSPNEVINSDPVMLALKKQIIQKRIYKKGLNRKISSNLEIEGNSSNFLDHVKNSSQELLNLYSQDEIYCTCRQGGESAITEFQILKSLHEKNVEQFYNYHTKLQQQVKFMICCDNCEEWYHYECMGIQKQREQQLDKYNCRICLQKNNIPFLILNENLWEQYIDSNSELYEDYQKHKILFEKNILPNSGEYIYSQFLLPTIEEFKQFVRIGEQLPAQLIELELLQLLEQRVDEWKLRYQDHTNLNLAQLIALYSESQWLPIQLSESKHLLSLISQREFLNTANELLQCKATFKTKQLKKYQQEKTEQLYLFIKQKYPEQLQEIDHLIIKTIQMLRIQADLNSQIQQQLKSQLTFEQYEQLANQFEKEVKHHILLTDIKFSLPKLTELRQQITKLQQWNAEILAIFKDIDDIYTTNLNQQHYDTKPYLSEIQVKLKEYEMISIKVPNLCYEFLKALQAKAEELIYIINNNLSQLSQDEQFELVKTVYLLKCKIPQFKDLLFSKLNKDVQMKVVEWLPPQNHGLN